jgi:PTH1 family peptidyl-tRNA hydrolase
MKCFVGLGNPGKKYESTRHNIGFMAIDAFASRWNIPMTGQKFKSIMGEGIVKGEKVILMKPQTYMNLSGESVRAFVDFYKASIDEIIIIYDDLDTGVGHMRLRYKGSAGGHNGIKSIIQHLGSQQFNRMRLGISRPQPGFDVADYVLSSFSKEERIVVGDMLPSVVDAMEDALQEPFEKVMAKYNKQAN